MGAPQVEDAAGGGEGVVLKIQHFGVSRLLSTLWNSTLISSTSHPC
jgi:hypothetical protein